MGFISEFKKFALRGNVMDMAVGIIIGAAFGKIVSSLVNDIIMPPIGKLMGNANFTDFFWALDGGTYESLAAAKEAGAPVIGYGAFLTTILDFVIIALAIFVVIKIMNNAARRMKEEEKSAPATPPKQEVLLTEIRDQLVALNSK